MLRRLYHDQPDSFAFTAANQAWAEAQISKYPEGRQASAIIPLLWRAQEQEGWLTRPAIEHVAEMLDMAYIRALEVASFYFMFQLQPVGKVAHIQICGTLSCMLCGAEDLVSVCREKIAAQAHALSADGNFSWEEVECLGSCANAPMAQIGKDYYEDLTTEKLAWIIDEMAAGRVPVPGPQNGRYAAEPLKGLTSLTAHDSGRTQYNGAVQLAVDIGDTIKRIDGTEVPLVAPWRDGPRGPQPDGDTTVKEPRPAKNRPADKTGVTEQEAAAVSKAKPVSKADPAGEVADAEEPRPARNQPADGTGVTEQEAHASSKGKPVSASDPAETPAEAAVAAADPEKPLTLSGPRAEGADDLKRISGVGPKLETLLNELGFWHFDQIAAWTPAEVAWVDSRLKFKGRIARDNWMEQAARFAAER